MAKQPPGSSRGMATRLRTATGRSTASQLWLTRQLNDPYVRAAKERGLRSRAAFKLLEMEEKLHLLKPGKRIVDLGAAPGGWTQVAVQAVGPKGQVVAIDILPMDPVPGATVLQGDFTEQEAEDRTIAAMGGKADVVLSDMAPNTTGHQATDHLRIMGFVVKVLEGGDMKAFVEACRATFTTVKIKRPKSTRPGSTETFVVGLARRGPARTATPPSPKTPKTPSPEPAPAAADQKPRR